MSGAMDVFLSTTDSLSFPDILDIDIKSEIDTLVGDHNDFSSLNYGEFAPLELEDVHDIKWFNTNSNHSNSLFDLYGDDGPTMVNPNAVMPVMPLSHIRSPSPSLKESHLTFSPSTIKIASIKKEPPTAVKKDLTQKLEDVEKKTIVQPLYKTIAKVTPITAKAQVKTVTKTPTLLTFRNTVTKQISVPIQVTQVSNVVNTVRTVSTGAHINRKIHLNNNNKCNFTGDERTFPKPAYSYSCLIAMALKNSRTGSLPVSEIYNFMCRHFPYFKTAPNGWKNSVRHNLSLNKCFEKIEKPAVNGSQRKGCLWAMNPTKISKMDEEVQKWSRKDPHAIRKAMVNPENLEALERGELKFSCSYYEGDNFGDSCGSAESEEGSDSEVEENKYQLITEVKENGEISDVDVEISDSQYEEDMDEDKELLRVEMALAEKELLAYEKTINNKRRRTYIIHN